MEQNVLEFDPAVTLLWFAACIYFLYCFTQYIEEYERKRVEKIRDKEKKDDGDQTK